MSDFVFARSQMGMSLAFHIVFAAIGISLPVLMVISEGLYLRTDRPVFWSLQNDGRAAQPFSSPSARCQEPCSRLSSACCGQASWKNRARSSGCRFRSRVSRFSPRLMRWKRLPPLVHWFCGVLVILGGVTSGIFVVTANAWMNTPAGFKIVDGKITDIDPIAAMLNPAAAHEVLHMTLAAFIATGFAVAAIHAFFLYRDRRNAFHRNALGMALALACTSAPLQLISGDFSARSVARLQPAKLAAMEAVYRTQTGAPWRLGGIPDNESRTTRFALTIPRGLSLLVNRDPNSKVIGLDQFAPNDLPNVRLVHWSFDLMILCELALIALSMAVGWLAWNHRGVPDGKWILRTIVAAGPLGFIAIEAGWMVTELGRQPWIIYGVMRTQEAVTPMQKIAIPFVIFTLIYVLLSVALLYLLRRQFRKTAAPMSELVTKNV